jgi:hypothetical protein
MSDDNVSGAGSSARTGERSPAPDRSSAYAWAAVGKETGRVLRNLDGHFAIYTKHFSAERDCPNYGEVRRVRVTVIRARNATGVGK